MQTLIEERNMSANEDMQGGYKLCPFCAEKIQALAIKCKHCGEFLNKQTQPQPAGKWYYSIPVLIAALLSLGPLALPLVWKNPKLKPGAKTTLTVAIIVLTILLCWAMVRAYVFMIDQIKALGM